MRPHPRAVVAIPAGSPPKSRSRCRIRATGSTPTFRALVDKIYALMTKRPDPAKPGARERRPRLGLGHGSTARFDQLARRHARGDRRRRPIEARPTFRHLADSLQMEIDELFPLGETLQLLRLAEFEEGDIKLTPLGQRFAEMDVDQRKKLFGDHLLAHLPLASHIKRVLDERPTHRARATRFREELEDYMSEDYAERTLRAIMNSAATANCSPMTRTARRSATRIRNSDAAVLRRRLVLTCLE